MLPRGPQLVQDTALVVVLAVLLNTIITDILNEKFFLSNIATLLAFVSKTFFVDMG